MSSDKPLRPEKLRDNHEKRSATSMPQVEECGMHGLQASFHHLKSGFVYKERGDQRITLKYLYYCSTFALFWLGSISFVMFICHFKIRMQLQNMLYEKILISLSSFTVTVVRMIRKCWKCKSFNRHIFFCQHIFIGVFYSVLFIPSFVLFKFA